MIRVVVVLSVVVVGVVAAAVGLRMRGGHLAEPARGPGSHARQKKLRAATTNRISLWAMIGYIFSNV